MSLRPGSPSSSRTAARSRRPQSLCLQLPTKPDVLTTFVHVESPERSHFQDDCPLRPSRPFTPVIGSPDKRYFPDWLRRPPAPPTPPSSPTQSGRLIAREGSFITAREAKERLQSILSSSSHSQDCENEKHVEIDDEKSQRIGDTGNPISSGDKLVIHSPSARPPSFSNSFKLPQSQLVNINTYLLSVFSDEVKYERFLSHRNESAQFLLDTLQILLDQYHLSVRLRLIVCVAVVRLTRKSELYPQCFNLLDVIYEKYPVAGGSYGEVYKGSFRGIAACVKVVRVYQKTSIDQKAMLHKAFFREAVLWGQLLHPNILPFLGIHHINDSRKRIALVSPWMRNGNIINFLEAQPNANRHLLASDVATGLWYLHRNGVVHGDLTPANTLVNDSGRACLVDFGLSTIADVEGLKGYVLSSTNPAGGAARRFQAPELADPDNECKRNKMSDVFSLGMVYYQIFAGKPPFDKHNDYSVPILYQRGRRPPRPKNGALTDTMWEVMGDCWAHSPEHRPDAQRVVDQLSQWGCERAPEWGDYLSPSKLRSSSGLVSLHDLRLVLETPTVAQVF